MNDLLLEKTYVFDQGAVLQAQEFVRDNLLPVEAEYNHYFASGCYARVMKVPAGSVVVGKAHKEDHICILLKGALTVTLDDGSTKYMQAPVIWVAKGGQKKLGLVHEDLEFVNVHANPDNTEDLEVIESRVIIPEEEYRLGVEKKEKLEMNKNNIEVTPCLGAL